MKNSNKIVSTEDELIFDTLPKSKKGIENYEPTNEGKGYVHLFVILLECTLIMFSFAVKHLWGSVKLNMYNRYKNTSNSKEKAYIQKQGKKELVLLKKALFKFSDVGWSIHDSIEDGTSERRTFVTEYVVDNILNSITDTVKEADKKYKEKLKEESNGKK